MMRRPSHRSLMHWLLLVALLLGGVFQPMLAAVGELHELTHGLSEQHLHDGEDVRTELAQADESGDRTAGTLHLIHHFAHCCGQVSAMLAPVIDAPLTVHAPLPIRPWTAQRVATEPALAPFRPPIRA